jgi:hypothetical protein
LSQRRLSDLEADLGRARREWLFLADTVEKLFQGVLLKNYFKGYGPID